MRKHTLSVAAFCLFALVATGAMSQNRERQRDVVVKDLVYPEFRNTGDLEKSVADHERALRDYDQKKSSLVTMPDVMGNTSSALPSAAPSRAGKNTQNTIQSNCIIPRDGSWIAVPRNDDGSLGPIGLPFTFDLYGSSYTSVWINTNGNLTFTGPVSAFTPSGFPIATPMVAPFWADVDTRNVACGQAWYKIEASRLLVTWENVGYYSNVCALQNTFQVIIGTYTDPVIGIGNNVKFNYGDMQWTTGQASGSGSGFAGTPATAGINKGNGIDFLQIGRFNVNSSVYDGPGGASDGISFLDDRCYGFNVSTAGNIAPVFSGLPAGNTVSLEVGQTAQLNIQAIPPEVTQTNSVSVNYGLLCGVSATTTSGAIADATIDITASLCNLGSNVITLSATDNAATPLTSSVDITLNVTCPSLTFTTCPLDIVTSNDLDNCSAVVSYDAFAASTIPVTYSYVFGGATSGGGAGTGSGQTFAKGVTTVTVSATNGCDTRTCSFTVTVNDTQAPVATVKPDQYMWPPNHEYQTVSAAEMVAAVTDNCATMSTADVRITSVSSDEPENSTGGGDGNTSDDIVIAGDCNSVQLRRERKGGGNGRVYTVHFSVSDPDGNTSSYTFRAYVPHSELGTSVDDGAVSGYTVNSPCSASPKPGDRMEIIPAGYALEQNFPNPFNPSTRISYSIPQDVAVKLTVFDMFGRTVAVLVDGERAAGAHSVSFDASNLVSGTYMYTFEANGVVINRTMNLLK
ncbi:MAG: T9SS type A sorting domain-containing protein [Ignavibacteriae bacterium]|nr:T9SS type A sorting domain-containing protein [Ignavibacteriota bacterium]